MESLPQKRRRSERRRLKMLRNQDEYKMVNPFKHSKEDTFVPNDVVNQLKKLDYLTQSSVSMIHLAHCCSQEDLSDALTNMTCALQSQ